MNQNMVDTKILSIVNQTIDMVMNSEKMTYAMSMVDEYVLVFSATEYVGEYVIGYHTKEHCFGIWDDISGFTDMGLYDSLVSAHNEHDYIIANFIFPHDSITNEDIKAIIMMEEMK